MAQRYELLSREEHERLRHGPTRNYIFAATTTIVPIIIDEISVVAREYPIIFPKNTEGLPCALTGTRPGINAYVDGEGRWLAAYIPMHIRQQPFILSAAPGAGPDEEKKRYSLAINPSAPEFQDVDGVRVFAPDGQLAPEAAAKVDVAKRIVERQDITREMVRALEEAGLLTELNIKIKLLNEEPRKIHGFRVIDEKKLNQIPSHEFVTLREKGVLPLAYAQLISMVNLRHGVLAGQTPLIHTDKSRGTEPKGDFDLSIFTDDDGDFSFHH